MPHRSGISGLPDRDEAASYYFKYIDRIQDPDVVAALEDQQATLLPRLRSVSEDASTRRYAPDKWSVRQVLNHVSDCERLFAARAFWFARGFDSELPSFDQEVSAVAAGADEVAWTTHVEEFEHVRLATLSLFRNLPATAWRRRGVASGNPFSVRALAYIAAGHADHHLASLEERYLSGATR